MYFYPSLSPSPPRQITPQPPQIPAALPPFPCFPTPRSFHPPLQPNRRPFISLTFHPQDDSSLPITYASFNTPSLPLPPHFPRLTAPAPHPPSFLPTHPVSPQQIGFNISQGQPFPTFIPRGPIQPWNQLCQTAPWPKK